MSDPASVPVTSIAADPAAREAAVQAAIEKTKAEAAIAALDAPEPPAPAAAQPSHGVVDSAAHVEAKQPEAVDAAEPLEETHPKIAVAPRALDYARFEALEAEVAELRGHLEDLVGHLAQSFGDVYKQKKDRMGV